MDYKAGSGKDEESRAHAGCPHEVERNGEDLLQVNMPHIRQPIPDAVLGFRIKNLMNFYVLSLPSCSLFARKQEARNLLDVHSHEGRAREVERERKNLVEVRREHPSAHQ